MSTILKISTYFFHKVFKKKRKSKSSFCPKPHKTGNIYLSGASYCRYILSPFVEVQIFKLYLYRLQKSPPRDKAMPEEFSINTAEPTYRILNEGYRNQTADKL